VVLSFLAVAVLLFIIAIVIFAIDLMIPTGGVLVGVTACFAFAAILVAFRAGTYTGIWMIIATLGATPVMLWAFLVLWPKTPIGRRMTSPPENVGEFVWSDAGKSKDKGSLVGSVGISLGEMIPSGLVDIAGQNFEAFSESGPIDSGTPVKVIRIDIGRLVVVAIREPKQTDAPKSTGTGLDRPISDFDLDSIDS
jgi:membrane-bound ClpP family serine protease